MTAFIEYKEGKVYDPAHLRPFNLALAKAGHPLARDNGQEIRLFRSALSDYNECGYAWDYWSTFFDTWVSGAEIFSHNLDGLCLAPLAVKDGRALHVGDVVMVKNDHFNKLPNIKEWNPLILTLDSFAFHRFVPSFEMDKLNRIVWRFADEVTT